MPTRQTYTVLIPFPTHAGHWSVVGEELDLLDVEATARLGAGRIQQRLGGETVDTERGVFRDRCVGFRRGADQTDHVIAQATHGLGGFARVDGDAVVLEVQNLSHD